MKNSILFVLSLLLMAGCDVYQKDGVYFEDDYNYGSRDKFKDYGENTFVDADDQAVSTFAIDADGGSYTVMRKFVDSEREVPIESVRVEEYINYFNFDYPDPVGENVSLNTEVSTCPWKTGHYILRVGMKGKSLDQRLPSNFVFLIDVSGSMKDSDKLDLLKTGFTHFTDQLGDKDRIAIVTYAGSSGVELKSTPGSEKSKIKRAIDRLKAGGSTAGADGIRTAYEIAEENFIENGNNRVVLGTDGDFNVGISSTNDLVELIEEKRDKGIFLTVLGVGLGNLNDEMMEQLANNGDGNYEYLDNEEQLKKVFIYEYDKFYTVAKDCKIQITFNKESVDSFRLIGYENRVLDSTEFNDDSTDAGEIGASQTITALYEIVPNTESTGDLASIDFRYKKPGESQSRLLEFAVANQVVEFGEASENTRFAASVAGLGMLLKQSNYKGSLTFDVAIGWASTARNYDPYRFRNEFVGLMNSIIGQ